MKYKKIRPVDQEYIQPVYTVASIRVDENGFRLVWLYLGTAFAGTVTDAEPSIHPLVPECSSWRVDDKVTLPLIGLDGTFCTN
jgi:hypothetical protein